MRELFDMVLGKAEFLGMTSGPQPQQKSPYDPRVLQAWGR